MPIDDGPHEWETMLEEGDFALIKSNVATLPGIVGPSIAHGDGTIYVITHQHYEHDRTYYFFHYHWEHCIKCLTPLPPQMVKMRDILNKL